MGVKETVSLTATAVVYVLFNLRLSSTGVIDSLAATGMQLLTTAPYVVGLTVLLVSFLQRMTGEKVPLDRGLRIFFTVGIIIGLFYGLNEYWLRG